MSHPYKLADFVFGVPGHRRRVEWRPKFKVGDMLGIVNELGRDTPLRVQDDVRVLKVDGRKRMSDPRPNRYFVKTWNREGGQVSGWVYEDDLEAF